MAEAAEYNEKWAKLTKSEGKTPHVDLEKVWLTESLDPLAPRPLRCGRVVRTSDKMPADRYEFQITRPIILSVTRVN